MPYDADFTHHALTDMRKLPPTTTVANARYDLIALVRLFRDCGPVALDAYFEAGRLTPPLNRWRPQQTQLIDFGDFVAQVSLTQSYHGSEELLTLKVQRVHPIRQI